MLYSRRLDKIKKYSLKEKYAFVNKTSVTLQMTPKGLLLKLDTNCLKKSPNSKLRGFNGSTKGYQNVLSNRHIN